MGKYRHKLFNINDEKITSPTTWLDYWHKLAVLAKELIRTLTAEEAFTQLGQKTKLN